jgi:hypothetical protein
MRTPTPQPPADNTLVLPKAVREALARSDALVAELYTAEGTPAAAEVAPEPAPAEPVVAPPAPATPEPVTTEGTPDWEHMYKSTKGRLDRTQGQVNELLERVNDLSRVPNTGTPPTPTPPPPTPKLITDQEITEYGADFLSVVGKKAREELAAEMSNMDRRFADLEGRVKGVSDVTAMSARDRMEAGLTLAIPNWRDVNFDENFLQWLRLPDAYSGVIRQTLLTQAYEHNETARVLAFFNGFLSEEAAEAPRGAQPVVPVVTPQGKIPLETFAAPGRAKTAAASQHAPAEKPTFSRAQISKFYTDVAAGKYRGRDDVRDRTEAAIFAAQAEGLIT